MWLSGTLTYFCLIYISSWFSIVKREDRVGKAVFELLIVAHSCNLNTQEEETGRL